MLELLQPTKSLPQSEESERAVLAAVLLDPRLLPTSSGRLKSEDFVSERHRLLYATMLDRVDYNLDKAEAEVMKGIEEMKKARSHQRTCVAS